MGRRGPPPKPTKLKVLEGNPGKRKLNPREPQPTGEARCPDFITGAGRAEWARVVGSMPPGFYSAADVPVLTVFVMSHIALRSALALVARDGMTRVGEGGEVTAHPAVAIAARNSELILRASDRLGMSPAARSRLTAPEDAPPSKFDGLIGRTGLRVVPPEEPGPAA